MSVKATEKNAVEMGTEKKRWGLKLFRVDGKGKVMDITDPDPTPAVYDPDIEGSRVPRFAMNYTRYNTESFSSECQHTHWIDVDALRLLAWDLMTNRKGDKNEKGYSPILEEFKGGLASAAGIKELGDTGIVSRHLVVTYNDTLNIGPCYQLFFELKEGKKGEKGQITPLRDGKVFVKETMNVPVANARKLGCRLYSYLQAKESAAVADGKRLGQ